MPKSNLSGRYQKTNNGILSGGYGVVQIWHDTSLARDVAIKWVEQENSGQLLSEVRALSRRPSPYIVEIYDVVIDNRGNLQAIILEYLSGNGLEEIDLTSKQQRQLAQGLLYQMAQGLADLHSVNLVHRDVKPANAVCTANGQLKLVDFGLSSPGNGAETAEARGTIGYAAPEFFGTKPIPISCAMDVYSFGMVCWQKLTGKLPKFGPILVPDSTYYPLPSIATRAELPTHLTQILDQCLSWSPECRPSMQNVADAFKAELIFGKHTACIMMPGSPPHNVTTAAGKVTSLKTQNSSLDIGYDGYTFTIKRVQGQVFVNNRPAVVGQALDLGCLLTFGEEMSRHFFPFRQSAPEIVF